MTIQWGRVLVYVNLVIAVGMGVWAFGLYSGRIEWGFKAKPAQSEVGKRIARLKELDNALTVAETRQRSAAAGLRLAEQRRPRDDQFFAQQLALLQNGLNAQNPLKVVDIQNGQIVLNPDGLPNMIAPKFAGPPLKSLTDLENEQKATQTALLESIGKYQESVDQDVKLTGLIVGDKGLRQLLYDEVDVKQARIKQEIEDLKPLYINVLVELQILDKRHKALEARAQELKLVGTRTTER